MKEHLRAVGMLVALCAAFAPTTAPAAAVDGLVALDGRWVMPEEAAAQPPAPATVPTDWGTNETNVWTVGACGAGTREDTHTFQAVNCQRLEPIPSETSTAVGWSVHVPTGALITGVRMHYFDNIGTEPSVGFYRVSSTGSLTSVAGLTPGPFSGGDRTHTVSLATPHQVTNAGRSYQILAILSRTGATTHHGIYGFEIHYRLQVSPAPAGATFPNDVPTTHPFFQFVEALSAAGITGGCGLDSYCPDSAVTRGQMAVFLSTALGLHFRDLPQGPLGE